METRDQKTKHNENLPIRSLPNELYNHTAAGGITAYLTPTDLSNAVQVCRSFYVLFQHDLNKRLHHKVLQHVAFGQLEQIQRVLEQASRIQDKIQLKQLLKSRGTAMTPEGVIDEDKTLLQCAIATGDPEVVEMIKSYFSGFEGAEEEKEKQIEPYRPCILAMQNQKPDDLMWLIDIIKQSKAEYVTAELATGDKYNPTYQSPLRDAMNKFRKAKLDPAVRVIPSGQYRLHCNYSNLSRAYAIYDDQWRNLIEGDNYNKLYLVSQQIIGLIHLLELPAYERYVFARGQAKEATAGKKIERSFSYKHGSGAYPDFSLVVFSSHSGVGFDSGISIFGGWGGGWAWDGAVLLQNLCRAKTSNLQNLCSPSQFTKRLGV